MRLLILLLALACPLVGFADGNVQTATHITQTTTQTVGQPTNEKIEIEKLRYDRDLYDATAVLAAFTFLLWITTAWLAWDQAGKMRESLTIAKISADAANVSANALKAQERAYLFVSVKMKGPLVTASQNVRSFAEMIIVNHGKTPAILTRLNGLIDTYSAFPEREYTKIQIDIPSGVQVIGPGCSESFELDFFLNQEKWNAIDSGHGMLLAIGRVQYEVVFGEKHETGFCWQFQDRLKDFYPADNHELNYRD